MRKTPFMLLVALAVLAAAACQDNPTVPSQPIVLEKPQEKNMPDIKIDALASTWQATKAEFYDWMFSKERRDLLAEVRAVTLVLEANHNYTLTATMPDDIPKVETGIWDYTDISMAFYTEQHELRCGFDMSLEGDTLELSHDDRGKSLLLEFALNYGWQPDKVGLILVFTRQ